MCLRARPAGGYRCEMSPLAGSVRAGDISSSTSSEKWSVKAEETGGWLDQNMQPIMMMVIYLF